MRTGPLAQRAVNRHRLGRAKIPVLAAFVALVGLALGVPVGSSIYWIFQGGAALDHRRVSLLSRVAHGALQRDRRSAGNSDGAPGGIAVVAAQQPGGKAPGKEHISWCSRYRGW